MNLRGGDLRAFAIPMGLTGLAFAWIRAADWIGSWAKTVAAAVAVLAAMALLCLLLMLAWRAVHNWGSLAAEIAQPAHRPYVAAVPVSLVLVATISMVLQGTGPIAHAVWLGCSAAQVVITVWIVSAWWTDMSWEAAVPSLLIPIVGNSLAPLGGVPLGHSTWALAQFGMGVLFWPIVLSMMLCNRATNGPMPRGALPSIFILVSPPAVVGLSALQLGAPPWSGLLLWGVALFWLLCSLRFLTLVLRQPFGIAHWALSFPTAAFVALTLRVSHDEPLLVPFGLLALAGASLGIAWLFLRTLCAVCLKAPPSNA